MPRTSSLGPATKKATIRRSPSRFAHVEISDPEQGTRRANSFVPTPAQRQLVVVFKATTVPDHVICHQLGISLTTLYKHFRDELDHGRDTVVSQVAMSVVKKALKGDNQMIMFYLRTHGPDIWKSTQKLEHSGVDGAPLAPPMLVVSFLEDEPTTIDVVTDPHERRTGNAAAP